MATVRSYRSAVAWGIAGVPILVTLLQTVLALLRTSGYAVFGGLVDVFHSLAVFDAAAPIFRESSGLVLLLFVLIAACWAAQGVSMFLTRNRDATFGAAGLVSVLFFALFLGVYSPLFGAGVPAPQLLLFFGAPVVAAAAAVVGALTHDWERDVVDEATGELVAVERAVDDAREAFDRAFDSEIGDLESLRRVAPAAARAGDDGRQRFLGRCEEIDQAVARLRELDHDAETLRRESTELRERADSLEPSAAVDATAGDVREALSDAVRDEFADVQVWSRYDRSYRLVNLPSRFREVHVGAFGTDVHVDRLADAVASRLDDGTAIRRIAEGVAEIRSHVERVESYLAEREDEFASAVESAEADLATVESQVERFDGAVGDRLAEYLVDGRHETLPGVRDARDSLDEARDALHDCRFDDATRLVDDAAATGERLVRLVEFLGAVSASIDHGHDTVSLPDAVEPAVVGDLQPAFERTHGVEFAVTDERIELDGGPTATDDRPGPPRSSAGGSAGRNRPNAGSGAAGATGGGATGSSGRGSTGGGGSGSTGGGGSGGGARPEDVIDSVLFVVRELERAAAEAETEIQLQTDDLPESVADAAVLDQLETFARRQTDVVDRVELQDGAPPGFLTVVPAGGTSPARAVEALHERYRDRYGGEA